MTTELHPFRHAPALVIWEVTPGTAPVVESCAGEVTLGGADTLTSDEAKRLLDQVHDLGARLVVMTGDDPTQREDLASLVRHGVARGLRVELAVSACAGLREADLTALKDGGLAALTLRLEGADAHAHEAVLGARGPWEHTLGLLAAARKIGLSARVSTTLDAEGADALEPLAALLATLGIDRWTVSVAVPPAEESPRESALEAALEGALRRLAALAERLPFEVKTTAAPQFRRVLLQHRAPREGAVERADGHGRVGREVNDGSGMVFVSHRGHVLPGGCLPIVCGDVRTASLAELYREHPLMKALRDDDRLGGRCGACEFRHVCGGSRARAYAATGDPLGEDPACAYVPRNYAPGD